MSGMIVVESAKDDPSAGARAHLVLMLVAHGERAAATALARHDPAGIVRASALRCLARIELLSVPSAA